jgi:hypothetical protein
MRKNSFNTPTFLAHFSSNSEPIPMIPCAGRKFEKFVSFIDTGEWYTKIHGLLSRLPPLRKIPTDCFTCEVL